MTEPDWLAIVELTRPLHYSQPVELSREVWHALRGLARERDADRDQARRRITDAQERLGRLAGDLAGALHQLRGLTRAARPGPVQADPLSAIAERQEAALRQAGIRVLDPVGERFAEDMATWVDVRHAEVVAGLAEPVIVETLRPGLMSDTGTLIRPAQVLIQVPAQPDPIATEDQTERGQCR